MPKQKTVLITRPMADAEPVAGKLAFRGFHVIAAPMMTIRFRENAQAKVQALLERKPQAILLTSANGARALARVTAERNIAVVAIGEASAGEARKHGFWQVDMAPAKLGGDANGLAAYLAKEYNPHRGDLIHICGAQVAGDLAALLAEKGFSVISAELYEARAVDTLPEEAVSCIRAGELDMALFYSPRTARIFLQLAAQAGLAGKFARTQAFALSRNVAAALSGTAWAGIYTAAAPTQEAMLALIEEEA